MTMPRKSKLIYDFDSALEHLQSENKLSSTALGALSSANKRDLEKFAQTWVRLPVERRRRAAQMLVDLAEDNIELDYDALFRYLLNDEDAPVRVSAIEGLWEDEDPALVKPLVGSLRSDPNAAVRAAAADSLGRFMLLAEYGRLPQSPHADLVYESLLATIHDSAEDIAVRRRAVEALAYSSRACVRDVIAAAYADDDADMRVSAVAAMGHSADAHWRKMVASELDSRDPRMRFEAARATGELEDRAAVPRLIEMLDDPDREVQMVTITALGQIGSRAAMDALTRTAASDDEVLRELANDALQEVRFAGDTNLLLFDWDADAELMEDEDDFDEE
jgi:HEAT repeat protein